jgi:hypothetical protein
VSKAKCIRVVVTGGGLAAAFFLVRGWRAQADAPLSCRAAFGELADHNGYIQINIVAPHAVEQYFEAELFLYYPSHESPPETLRLVRDAKGQYAPSILSTPLVPWSKGLATPKPVPLALPTPGVSLKHFPFDSRTFNFTLQFTPPRRPKVVLVRNHTADFIPVCGGLVSDWDGNDRLTVTVAFHRNPFVQATVVIIGLGALAFGLLLGRIREAEDLAMATASYFFSVWSVRGIVAPSGLAYPTLLDFWLMAVSIMVLFVVAWRLSVGAGKPT